MFAAIGLSQIQLEFPALSQAQSAIGRIFPIAYRKPIIDASSPKGITPQQVTEAGRVPGGGGGPLLIACRPATCLLNRLCAAHAY